MLLNSIMSNFFPSVIFCQEMPGHFKTEVVNKCGTGGFTFVKTGGEAAVMWAEEDFDGFAVDTKETFIVRIVEKLTNFSSWQPIEKPIFF